MTESVPDRNSSVFNESEIRQFADAIRITQLRSFKEMGYGHIGGSMSISELLAVLYGAVMRYDPANPGWDGRDYLVLSKGHCAVALYAALALKGFFPFEEIYTANKPGTRLPSHCDRNKTPGVDMSTGSLGQGISAAAGIAKGLKLRGRKNRVYLILGDGECDEGQVWEGLLFASQHQLDNLTIFVDYNKKQLDGYLDDVCGLGDLPAKFREFGCAVQSIDGHDCGAIYSAVQETRETSGKPVAIILNTVKGKGCSFAENEFLNHYMAFSGELADEAIKCIEGRG